MKFLAICLCFPLLTNAQEAEPQTRLHGPVSDGTPPVTVSQPAPIHYRIESSRTVRLPDGKLTIRRVQPPAAKPVRGQSAPEALPETAAESEIHGTELIHVSATVHQERLTYLRWWTEGREHSAWMDINFHNFSGITGFAHKNRDYALIMGIVDDETMPRGAWWPRTPGSFLLLPDNADNPKAVEFAEAFVALYAQEKDMLIAARKGREEAAIAAALQAPAAPADSVLTFWDKPSRPLNAVEKAERNRNTEVAR